ncbi:hypothetical protein LguiB_016908 [Lonicera macranthoides]
MYKEIKDWMVDIAGYFFKSGDTVPLAQNVQKALLLSDVKSKSDKTPVTVADYGSGQLSFAERTPRQHVLTSGGGGE